MHSFYHVFTIIIGITGTGPIRIGVECATTPVPVNTLVVVGKTARINCSTGMNQPVYWARTLAGSYVLHWFYYGRNGFNGNNTDNRFSIDKDEATGRYDVIIADVQLKDAGQYVCVDESGLGAARASAELVVSDPMKCNSCMPSDGVMGYNIFGIEQDLIHVSCSLTYAGNLSPTLEWSWPGSGVQNDEHDVSPTTSFVTSAIKLSPTKELNNVKFKCIANIEGATQHKIDRGLLWESETVNVRYTEFGSDEVDMCPGVKWNLHCNPPCSYHFERVDDVCQCLYTYYDTRTQQKYEVTSDAIKCGKDSDILLAFYVAVAFVIDLSATVIIIIVLACYSTNWTKRRTSDDTTECGQDSKGNKSRDNICA